MSSAKNAKVQSLPSRHPASCLNNCSSVRCGTENICRAVEASRGDICSTWRKERVGKLLRKRLQFSKDDEEFLRGGRDFRLKEFHE